jgi:hypothetical protein
MMQSFKKFLEEAKFNKGTIITAEPVHGNHSKPPRQPKLIDKDPVHGAHSKPPQKIKEEHENRYDLDNDGNQHIKDFVRKNHNEHLGNDHYEVHHALNLTHEDFHKNEHAPSLYKYSKQSWETNKELLNKATGQPSLPSLTPSQYDSESSKEYKKENAQIHDEHVKSLDASFHHPNAVLKHDVHVFHGTNKFNPGEEAKKGSGRITMPGYTSTSIDPKTAHDFAGTSDDSHIIHIHLKKGQRAHYLGSHSNYDNEKEMMLPRNTTLQIHPTPTVTHNGDGTKTHVWHGHVVGEAQPAPRKTEHDKDQMKFNF